MREQYFFGILKQFVKCLIFMSKSVLYVLYSSNELKGFDFPQVMFFIICIRNITVTDES